MKRSMLAAVVVLGFSGSAFAQLGPEEVIQAPDTVKVRGVTDVDFSEVVLEVGRSGPAISYGDVRPGAKFANRIQVRTNFTPELQGSVDNL